MIPAQRPIDRTQAANKDLSLRVILLTLVGVRGTPDRRKLYVSIGLTLEVIAIARLIPREETARRRQERHVDQVGVCSLFIYWLTFLFPTSLSVDDVAVGCLPGLTKL